MAFGGRDYNAAFEEACENLALEHDPEEIRSELEGVEWVLWEAIRGVFFYVAIAVAWLIVMPLTYLLDARQSWTGVAVGFAAFILFAVTVYWLCRVIFHFEIATHVRGRKFGSGGLDR